MNFLDIILLVPLLFALYRGFKKGLVHMIASLAALILGILGAIKLRPVFAGLLDSWFNIDPSHLNIIAFAVAFVLIVIVVHLIAFFVDKLIKAVALNFINRLLGMVFGVVITALVISMILWPINEVNRQRKSKGQEGLIKNERIEGSLLYEPLSSLAPAFLGILKVKDLRDYIPDLKKDEKENKIVAINP